MSDIRIDALDLELFRHAVGSVVDELDVNVSRTAHSPIVYDYKDYCVGILTADFRLIGQSKLNLPFFLADMGTSVADAVEVIGVENLRPGDVFLHNYSPVSGQQSNHVITATPVYDEQERIAGYVAIRTHWVDIGGIVPGSISWDATSRLQEGLQLRGLRVVREGRVEPEVVATIEANTYMPQDVVGDLMALTAACLLGARRWKEEVIHRWPGDEVAAFVEAQFADSRRFVREAVSRLPDGEYAASVRTDDGGRPGTPPLELKVKLEIRGDTIVVDLSDLPPQSDSPINTGAMGGAISAMRVAFKSLVAPERVADEALFEPLEVRIPPGTFLSATGMAPMGHWNMTMPTMIDLFFKAIGSVHPELVAAGHHATMAGLMVFHHTETGEVRMSGSTQIGGFGAHAEGDGFGPLNTLMHGDNQTEPMELTEARMPMRFHTFRSREGSGGDGLHRGGPGVERIWEALAPVTITTLLERTVDPPWGLAGGQPGKTGGFWVKYPGGDTWTAVNKVTSLPLPAGTLFRTWSAGGGGWGTPPTAPPDETTGESPEHGV
ncbi:hydantoinase B/oxoprolinase family protein [Nocardioides sp. NPDC051685]|uniref:hydantoinase B/oxoprolinase family protein n=1 Tax=Nocardioides sp. NPDC051685 TaxID=3364334 RepID=UPI0037ABB7EC